jgi:hypothetical protein
MGDAGKRLDHALTGSCRVEQSPVLHLYLQGIKRDDCATEWKFLNDTCMSFGPA